LNVCSRAQHDGDTVLVATMTVGYRAIRESFSSRVTLKPQGNEIAVAYLDGPFSHLDNRWRFIDIPGGSEVHFFIDYAFASRMLSLVMGAVFDKAVRDTILEINAGLPRGQRIAGAILLGSFANGAAGPGSDLDVQTLAENGSPVHIERFVQRLRERWDEAGMSHHELGPYQYALPLSRGLIRRLHREPYLLFTPYPEVRELMRYSPVGSARQWRPRRRGLTGRVFNRLYMGVVASILAAYELRRLARA